MVQVKCVDTNSDPNVSQYPMAIARPCHKTYMAIFNVFIYIYSICIYNLYLYIYYSSICHFYFSNAKCPYALRDLYVNLDSRSILMRDTITCG
jgi:hypothetical protein